MNIFIFRTRENITDDESKSVVILSFSLAILATSVLGLIRLSGICSVSCDTLISIYVILLFIGYPIIFVVFKEKIRNYLHKQMIVSKIRKYQFYIILGFIFYSHLEAMIWYFKVFCTD